MLTQEEIISQCQQDIRNIVGFDDRWVKHNHIDLVIKYIIFLFNCCGRYKRSRSAYIFLDEIRNSSMHNNMLATYEKLTSSGSNAYYCSFYERSGNSIKLGIAHSVKEIILTLLSLAYFSILTGFIHNTPDRILKFLVDRYTGQLDRISEKTSIFLMTDHHFFSSVTAMHGKQRTLVLQHGLIMDQRFYYPIRATKFLAWGERSREIQYNDAKVEVTGTYKFSQISAMTLSEIKTLIFCVNSHDDQAVKQKIDILYEICQEYGYHLIVKCHPGSLFGLKQWTDMYTGKPITFYKEERLQDIPFDAAVTENSTIIIDLIAMGKPFVLFDDINGYFSEYEQLIPHGSEKKEIADIINNLGNIDFERILSVLLNREINNGVCSIAERKDTL